jgi:RimJ/RimL family protein N-acetyltransferase
VFDRVAANVASVVEDGSCLGFSVGPLYEALARHLTGKRHLGIHSPFITDPVMDLVKSGAVTNRRKATFRGKCVASYALGSKQLCRWLERNPLVELQGTDKVFNPLEIGRNSDFVAILPARKVGLSGGIALHVGKGNVPAGPGEAIDFVNGAELSPGGSTVFALPSRNREGRPNILPSVDEHPNQFSIRESVDCVVTEYGVASLTGRTVRERAQALIEVAHPDDRRGLVEAAKALRILYEDQVFLEESSHLYPSDLAVTKELGGVEVRFRAIRPSDEEQMRRLFYRFSDRTVYYRYFSPIKTMPHAKMQEYVNVDYREVVSLVGLVGPPEQGRIVAEGRFVRRRAKPVADLAFVVDEEFQGRGIATFMYGLLVRIARDRGVQTFTADVLASNKAMMKVLERGGVPFSAALDQGAYGISIALDGREASRRGRTGDGNA